MTVVFVDFDGVLHPLDCEQAGAEKFCYLCSLESVLRDFPDAHIVVCSEWRKGTAWNEILGFFASDIRERILGATPVLPLDEAQPTALRQREALEFLRQAGLEAARWVARRSAGQLGSGRAAADRVRGRVLRARGAAAETSAQVALTTAASQASGVSSRALQSSS